MSKIYLIHNTVFLPIEQNYNDSIKTEQKYIGSSIRGGVYINQIYTESELLKEYGNNPDFKTCKHLHDLTKTWGNKDY